MNWHTVYDLTIAVVAAIFFIHYLAWKAHAKAADRECADLERKLQGERTNARICGSP